MSDDYTKRVQTEREPKVFTGPQLAQWRNISINIAIL